MGNADSKLRTWLAQVPSWFPGPAGLWQLHLKSSVALSMGLYPVGRLLALQRVNMYTGGRRYVQNANRGGRHPREPMGSETLSLNSPMRRGKMGVS